MNVKSVRIKLLAVFVPLFIISFMLMSFISYRMASQSLGKYAEDIARASGEEAALKLRNDINVVLVPLKGISKYEVWRTGDNAAKAAALKEVQKDHPSILSIMVTDKAGKAVRQDGKTLDRGSRAYFKTAMSTKSPYASEPFKGSTNDHMMTMLVQPIIVNGEAVGALMASIDLNVLSEHIDAIKFMDSGYMYITDKTGKIVGFNKNQAVVNKVNIATGTNEADGLPIDKNLSASFQQAMSSKAQAVGTYNEANGTEMFSLITPVEIFGNIWTIVTVAPVAEVNQPAHHLMLATAGISLVTLLVVIIAIWLFAKRIADPLELLRNECARLNSGDFTTSKLNIEGEDEIGQLAKGFSEMQRTIAKLVKNVQEKSVGVAAASSELEANADRSAQVSGMVAENIATIVEGVANQTEATKDIEATISQISEESRDLAENAKRILANAMQTAEHVKEGRSTIVEVVSQMDSITESTGRISSSIDELDSSSKKIGEMLSLINGIAEQTNLLALNAAIEAARAGEAGRGFAVVADEVRKLAEESANASQQISELIMGNQQNMEAAIADSSSGAESVRAGIAKVRAADAVFEEIMDTITVLVKDINGISDGIQKIAEDNSTVLEASMNIAQISNENTEAAQSVSESTEAQTGSVKEIAGASQDLAGLATDLQNELKQFKI